MVFLSVLLALTLCLELRASRAPVHLEPDTRCSQGLRCKLKHLSPFSPRCRRRQPEGSASAMSDIRNVSLSTTLRCQGRQRCALRLRVSVSLLLNESVHGLSICILTPGMMPKCKQVTFTKSSRRRMKGSLVEVESEYEEIAPGQEGRVKVQTLPGLCGERWTGTFQGPECSSGDLRSQVPQCITGSLHYELHPGGGGLTVEVLDMLEDSDYRLRLCLEGYVCTSTGANALIKKEEAVKKVSLPFSRPLPCLCIEGWSAVMDAPRVRVCPFKERLDELWFGVTYDPMEGELSWQPACPVDVAVSLFMARGEGHCEDLPGAAPQRTRGSKVTFSRVDPHPQLCIKWTMASQSWTRCPFANKTFQGTELRPTCAP